MTAGALCRPETFPVRRTVHCPTCNSEQRMAGYLAIWYGQTLTCLNCGDMWTDGEMHPRPFKPRWRKENIAAAQKWWDEAEGYTDADRQAWISAQLDDGRAVAQ